MVMKCNVLNSSVCQAYSLPAVKISVFELLADAKVTVPDLLPQDFHLVGVIKSLLKGQCFCNVDEVKDAPTAVLKRILENDCQQPALLPRTVQPMAKVCSCPSTGSPRLSYIICSHP